MACHGGVVEASFIAFGRQPIRDVFAGNVINTSITEWLLPESATDWSLIRFNDAAHLADVS